MVIIIAAMDIIINLFLELSSSCMSIDRKDSMRLVIRANSALKKVQASNILTIVILKVDTPFHAFCVLKTQVQVFK